MPESLKQPHITISEERESRSSDLTDIQNKQSRKLIIDNMSNLDKEQDSRHNEFEKQQHQKSKIMEAENRPNQQKREDFEKQKNNNQSNKRVENGIPRNRMNKPRTHLVGASRIRDIYHHTKSQGYTNINTRFKSGSTISWARGEIRNIESGANVIVQTGINNIRNTRQENDNILHQFRELIKENTDKNIIITSILPAANRSGETYARVSTINDGLKKIANQERVTYIDLEGEFLKENRLNFELYKYEGKYLHLNSAGNEIFIKKVDEAMRLTGVTFLKLDQVFWRTSLPRRRK